MTRKILVKNLQSFNHGSQGITYNVNSLTCEEYNNIYLELCDMYNHVDQSHCTLSRFQDKMLGYVLCK